MMLVMMMMRRRSRSIGTRSSSSSSSSGGGRSGVIVVKHVVSRDEINEKIKVIVANNDTSEITVLQCASLLKINQSL